MTEKTIETYYQNKAKQLVDFLFDNKMFSPDLTRDNLQSVEDLIAFEYQSSADSIKRGMEFLAKLTKGKN